jgi:hypothetical protein
VRGAVVPQGQMTVVTRAAWAALGVTEPLFWFGRTETQEGLMDESSFLGLPTFVWWALLFCFYVVFGTFLFRTIVEGVRPKLKNSLVWRNQILTVFPLWLGAITAFFFKGFTYPEDVGTRAFARIMYGLVIGGCSRWIFKIVKARVKTTWGVDIDLSNPPQEGMEVNVQVKVPPQDAPPTVADLGPRQ